MWKAPGPTSLIWFPASEIERRFERETSDQFSEQMQLSDSQRNLKQRLNFYSNFSRKSQ
jgi:hypothetical protein